MNYAFSVSFLFFFFFLPKVLCRCFKWLVSYYTHNGESDFRNTILGGVASRYFCPLLWPAKITIFCRVSLLSFEPLPWIKALSLRFLERKIIASQHEVKDIFLSWNVDNLFQTTGIGAEATCMMEVRKCMTAEPQHLQWAVREKINFLNDCFLADSCRAHWQLVEVCVKFPFPCERRKIRGFKTKSLMFHLLLSFFWWPVFFVDTIFAVNWV